MSSPSDAEQRVSVIRTYNQVAEEQLDALDASGYVPDLSAIDALIAQGIDPEPLIITSIGNTLLGNPLVVDGVLDGTVFQSSSWDGENAAVIGHQVLTEGSSPPPPAWPGSSRRSRRWRRSWRRRASRSWRSTSTRPR